MGGLSLPGPPAPDRQFLAVPSGRAARAPDGTADILFEIGVVYWNKRSQYLFLGVNEPWLFGNLITTITTSTGNDRSEVIIIIIVGVFDIMKI